MSSKVGYTTGSTFSNAAGRCSSPFAVFFFVYLRYSFHRLVCEIQSLHLSLHATCTYTGDALEICKVCGLLFTQRWFDELIKVNVQTRHRRLLPGLVSAGSIPAASLEIR